MQTIKKSYAIKHHVKAGSRSLSGTKIFICSFCKSSFLGYKSSNLKYCSLFCYQEYNKTKKETIICKYCSIEFISYVRLKRMFCSSKCQNDYYRLVKSPREQGKKIIVTCGYCGKEFKEYPGTKFCSRKCLSDACKVRTECEVCGKVFYHDKRWKARFCSNACVGIYNHRRAGTIVRKRSDNVFSKELKLSVRYFYGDVCFICHLKNSNTKSCSCHHIDYDKTNNSFYNLVPLCQRCHEKTNHNRNYWQQILKILVIVRSMNIIKNISNSLLIAKPKED